MSKKEPKEGPTKEKPTKRYKVSKVLIAKPLRLEDNPIYNKNRVRKPLGLKSLKAKRINKFFRFRVEMFSLLKDITHLLSKKTNKKFSQVTVLEIGLQVISQLNAKQLLQHYAESFDPEE